MKKGISLITLIITIVVVVILAASVIISLNNTNIIDNTNKAKLLNTLTTYKSKLDLYNNEMLLENYGYDYKTLQADEKSYSINGKIVPGKTILDVIGPIENVDISKLKIVNGELVFKPSSSKESEWVDKIIQTDKSEEENSQEKNNIAKIVFDPNGGIGGPKEIISDNYWIDFPDEEPIPPAGKAFIGWYYKKLGTLEEVIQDSYNLSGNYAQMMVSEMALIKQPNPYFSGNTTLYAVYGDKAYNLSYNLNGGKNDIASQMSCNNLPIFSLRNKVPTMDGKYFAGWNTSIDGKGIKRLPGLNNEAIELSSDETLYAMWTDKSYSVKYNMNGSNQSLKNEVGKVVRLSLNFKKDDNLGIVVEWNTAKDGSGKKYLPGQWIDLTEDITLYAIWKKNNILTYDTNGGYPLTRKDKGIYFIKPTNEIPVSTNKNLIFVGWSKDRSGTNIIPKDTFIELKNDTTLYAIWKKPCTLIYDANGGSNAPSMQREVPGDVKIKISSKIPNLNNNELAFVGWNTQKDGNGKYYKSGNIIELENNDLRLYAIWKEKKSVFMANEGTYVEIPGNKLKWVILNKDNGVSGVEVIAMDTIKSLTLKGKKDYMSLITRLNSEAEEYRKNNAIEYTKSARSVGSKPSNPEYLGTIGEENIHFYPGLKDSEDIDKIDVSNTHHLIDYEKLEKLKIANIGKEYFLASRYAYNYHDYFDSYDVIVYNPNCVGKNGYTYTSSYGIVNANENNRISESSTTLGIRPCMTLNTNLKIVGGTGTINDPYKLQK